MEGKHAFLVRTDEGQKSVDDNVIQWEQRKRARNKRTQRRAFSEVKNEFGRTHKLFFGLRKRGHTKKAPDFVASQPSGSYLVTTSPFFSVLPPLVLPDARRQQNVTTNRAA